MKVCTLALAFALLFLTVCAVSVPRIVLKSKALDAVVNTMMAWGMETLYSPEDISRYQLSGYSLEGSSPCAAHDPSIIVSHLYTHRDSSFIVDFAVLGDVVYYMTDEGVYALGLERPNVFAGENATRIFERAKHGFTYLDAFRFEGSSDTVFFFKGNAAAFSYAVLQSGQTVLPSDLGSTSQDLSEFNDEMKLSVYRDFVFIPAGSKGIYQYKYSADEHRLNFVGTVSLSSPSEPDQDIRDVTIRDFSGPNEALIIAADYKRGIVMTRFNVLTRDTVLLQSVLEFVKAKSVTWTVRDGQNKLIVIADGLSNISKLIVLTFRVAESGEMELHYDQIKILDGFAQYGDADQEYATILMPNSVMVTKLSDQRGNLITYLNNQGVKHTKLYRPDAGRTTWLLYTRGVELVGTYLSATKGFIMCEIGAGEQNYNFKVLGRSSVCGLDTQNYTVRECDYEVDVALHVSASTFDEAWENIKMIVFAIVGVMIVLLVALIISVIVVAIRYRRAQRSLSEYERLGAGKNKSALPATVDMSPMDKTDQSVTIDDNKKREQAKK
ncbi:MAG: hypothetical protein P4M11_03170 [Candidatus Pacebacteria bacterium]|nr:hypothetical protein [Candidatus Paceibacterota bacterium]